MGMSSRAGGYECPGALPALRHLAAHRLLLGAGGGGRPGRPLPASPPFAGPDPGGARARRPGGPRCAPCLGRPQAPRGLAPTRLPARAQPQHHHRDPAPERPAYPPRANPTQRATVRACPPQRPLADGLQGQEVSPPGGHSRFPSSCRPAPKMKAGLTATFRSYGLPLRIPPRSWLMRLGIGVSHGADQGKGAATGPHSEAKAEVLQGRWFADGAACQESPTARPHEAISRYAPSPRRFPDVPPIEYGDSEGGQGLVHFKGRDRALRGYPVALRPTASDGVWGCGS